MNRWLPENPINADVQAIGTAGPTDPEVGMLGSDDLDGRLLAVMYHFTLHANSDFVPAFSADYPGVVKERSPFPWTYPIELSNDALGYLITHDAWEGGGYEALTCDSIYVDVSGVSLMVDRSLDLLRALR